MFDGDGFLHGGGAGLGSVQTKNTAAGRATYADLPPGNLLVFQLVTRLALGARRDHSLLLFLWLGQHMVFLQALIGPGTGRFSAEMNSWPDQRL